MRSDTLNQALELADRLTHVFVATADSDGMPHLAAAERLERMPDDRISVSYWFCPQTVANLEVNPKISLVVWDSESDEGYQILGETQFPQDVGMMDGYSPEIEAQEEHIPHVERQLLIHVDKIIAFSHKPHRDEEA
jgi:hypothetical protein